MPKDILGGGFVDYDTNTCINAILWNLGLNSTKPSPKMSLGISWNDQFQTIYWEGNLVAYSILKSGTPMPPIGSNRNQKQSGGGILVQQKNGQNISNKNNGSVASKGAFILLCLTISTD